VSRTLVYKVSGDIKRGRQSNVSKDVILGTCERQSRYRRSLVPKIKVGSAKGDQVINTPWQWRCCAKQCPSACIGSIRCFPAFEGQPGHVNVGTCSLAYTRNIPEPCSSISLKMLAAMSRDNAKGDRLVHCGVWPDGCQFQQTGGQVYFGSRCRV
jgi:hypothetical protein